jgi:hypothetical protein
MEEKNLSTKDTNFHEKKKINYEFTQHPLRPPKPCLLRAIAASATARRRRSTSTQ